VSSSIPQRPELVSPRKTAGPRRQRRARVSTASRTGYLRPVTRFGTCMRPRASGWGAWTRTRSQRPDSAGSPRTRSRPDRPEEADCLVVNTCAFIDRAKTESIETILHLAALKAEGTGRRLVVTGCLPQRYGAELLGELPEVDAVLGTGELHRIVDVVGRA